jgi:hypothetical protein
VSLLELKQKVARLSQRDRRELQLYLIKLKHQTPAWRKATAKTIRAMKAGKYTPIEELEAIHRRR